MVEDDEKDIINQLAESLQIPEETAISIIEVLIITGLGLKTSDSGKSCNGFSGVFVSKRQSAADRADESCRLSGARYSGGPRV